MLLTFQQINSITQGAFWLDNTDGLVGFHRFSREEEEMYAPTQFRGRSLSTSGIQLIFNFLVTNGIKIAQRKIFQFFLQCGGQILMIGDDHTVGRQMTDGGSLLVIHNGSQHSCAKSLGHRNDYAGKTAGTGLHQQGVTGLQAAFPE